MTPPSQPSIAFHSRNRTVHLVCTSDSPFVKAVRPYLADLGLTVQAHAVRSSTELRELIGVLASPENPAQVAVLPIEGQQADADAPGHVPGSRLPALTVTAIEVCAAQLTSERCLAVAQLADPVEDADGLSIETLRLANSLEARTALKQRLSDAGCTIAGQVLAEDQPSHHFEFPKDWWGVSDEPAGSPSFTEFLVDSAFNRTLTQSKLQEEAMERVKKAEELDLKYHYVGWKMAENWNALTDDDTYGHETHRAAVSRQISAMATVLPKDTTFRYVSLGPGDGKTDVALLPQLTKELTILSCFFVDVSIELLQVATNRVITELFEESDFSPRQIRAVLGDFEDRLSKLAPVLTGPGERSFFSLSGFTVGNSRERQLINSLSEGMQPGDFLLMDARLHGLGRVTSISEDQKRSLIAPYNSFAMKKFAFGPVEDLCDYTVRLEDEESVRIDFEPKVGTSVTTDVSNAINVYIDASGMYASPEFRTKVGLKARIPLGTAGREKKKRLRLVTLTFYDFDSLAQWIDETNVFKVRWRRDLQDGTGLLLLERLA